jgi:hypothetical protein
MPEQSSLSPDDVVLFVYEQCSEVEFFDHEIETKFGTYTVKRPIETTKTIGVYYVVSRTKYQQLLDDYPVG